MISLTRLSKTTGFCDFGVEPGGSALLSYFWTRLTTQTLVIYQTDVRQVFFCGAYFWAGAVYYRFKFDRFFSLSATLAACVLMLCLEPYPDLLRIASWGALPFVVLAFGLSDSPALNHLLGKNDVSYGVYIYAFPIQQAVVYLYPTVPLVPYLAICCGLTLALAYISWHAIESRALKLKPKVQYKNH